MIFDTDILSIFGKIGRIYLLKKLFYDSDIIITLEVYNELLRAKDAGYDFVEDIFEIKFKVIQLDQDLIKEYEQSKDKLKNVHSGELSSILYSANTPPPNPQSPASAPRKPRPSVLQTARCM